MTRPDVSSDANVEGEDIDTSPQSSPQNISDAADIGTAVEADIAELTDPILPVDTSSQDDMLVTDDIQPQRSDGT